MNKEGKYTTGDLAERFGLSTETIRNYENDFNLDISRDNQNNRSYTEENIKIYEEIVKLKAEGLSIAEINIRLYDEKEDNIKKLDRLIEEVNKKKTTIEKYAVEFDKIKENIEADMDKFINKDIEKFIHQESEKVSKKIKKVEKKLSNILEKIK